MTPAHTVTVSTPAKINLGLEILGKRADGFHEIRTVMAAIDLADTIHLSRHSDSEGIRISGVPGVRPEDNIIARAVEAFAETTGIRAGLDIVVEKRIPSPGGLGGASSNAAGTLLALDSMFETMLPPPCLQSMAARLGSDAPFFLGTVCALATGTGTALQPLPPLEAAVVLVTPPVSIAAKTATLYGALRPDDFSDGTDVDALARSLKRGDTPAPGTLANTFARPLYELDPSLKALSDTIRDAGASHVALTGAGPGHYVLVDSIDIARSLAGAVRERVGQDVGVTATRILTGSSMPVTLER